MQKFKTISIIPEMNLSATANAERTFLNLKQDGVLFGNFGDNVWRIYDEYSKRTISFEIGRYIDHFGLNKMQFILYEKTYIIFRIGELVSTSLIQIVNAINTIMSAEELNREVIDAEMSYQLSEFFSLLPCDCSLVLDLLYESEAINYGAKKQRDLALFESYFLFNDLLDRFWEECKDISMKLFYFPVYFWWNITAIIPTRPRECILTSRNCLLRLKSGYQLTLRKNKLKGAHKTVSYKIDKDYFDFSFTIPEKLAKEIQWYLDKTEDMPANELNTLFLLEPHYGRMGANTSYRNRFYSLSNLYTCLRLFYKEIISEKYGYEIVFEQSDYLKPNTIQYFCLGDTRHIAEISIVYQGVAPQMAMKLAGQNNIDIAAHYFSNISTFIESKTHYLYFKRKHETGSFKISKYSPKSGQYVRLNEGRRCYSDKVMKHDFSHCRTVIGPNGEIGWCGNCPFCRTDGRVYHNSSDHLKTMIEKDIELLKIILKKARKNKGYEGELVRAWQLLEADEYSYEKYLLETESEKWEEKEK